MEAMIRKVRFGAAPQANDASVKMPMHDQEKAFAPKHGGKPRRRRQDDGVRDEIARLNPRRLRHRGREIAGDRVQRDADDRGVEHFDEGRQNHRDRDDPRIDFRLVGISPFISAKILV